MAIPIFQPPIEGLTAKRDESLAREFSGIGAGGILAGVQPLNGDDIAAALAEGRGDEIGFETAASRKSPAELRSRVYRLLSLRERILGGLIGEGLPESVKNLYLEAVAESVLETEFLLAEPDSPARAEKAVALFPPVTEDEVRRARAEIPGKLAPIEAFETVPAFAVAERAQEMLWECELWHTVALDFGMRSGRIKRSGDKLVINPREAFAAHEVRNLLRHEISHAMRAGNALLQDFKLFQLGTANSAQGAEGIAEALFRATDAGEGATYERDALAALRVVAIWEGQKGRTLQGIYDHLREKYGVSPSLAAETAIRVKRGVSELPGVALGKDAMYFRGAEEFLALRAEDQRLLWSGLVKPADLPLVRDVLNPPRWVIA